jgi:ribosomal protein S18 acetylase RimI-like enzyme
MIIRNAAPADLPALVALVNAAYRGDTARRGWTHEADLLDGQRIDRAMLDEMLADPAQHLLVAEEDGRLVGCAAVADKGGFAYLGMLTVDPERQGGGLGRRLAAAGEHLARALGRSRVRMTVIETRHELIAWYGRLGYAPTGEREPFPSGDPRFGLPRRDLAFLVLEKPLG